MTAKSKNYWCEKQSLCSKTAPKKAAATAGREKTNLERESRRGENEIGLARLKSKLFGRGEIEEREEKANNQREIADIDWHLPGEERWELGGSKK